jgi:GNAT superfamily N-acetyltransferase
MARRYGPVERLGDGHEVSEFDCGSSSLTEWLRRYGRLAQQSGTCRVYVGTRADERKVVGFYGLATGAVLPEDATPRFLKGAGNYPQPVVILARLAVDIGEQGRGLGVALLKDALIRVASAADIVGVRGLLIHAEDEQAREFYMRLADFEQSPTDPLHLLLLMKDLRKALPDTV